MYVYLDSKDLIEVLERGAPCTVDDLNRRLRAGDHRLVLSFGTVSELAAPLLNRCSRTNVMHLLNRLEELPHVFLADVQIERLELEEALRAWASGASGDEYRPIDPFVVRLDHTLPLPGAPPTASFVNLGMGELIYLLWTSVPGIFRGHADHIAALQELVAADRSLATLPPGRSHFPVVIRRQLRLFQLHEPLDFDEFGKWLYESPARCPARRLTHEIYRRIVMNRSYRPRSSDFEDLLHIAAAPYVDMLTLDGAMYDYLRQVSLALEQPYVDKVHRNLVTVLATLDSDATGAE